MKKNGGGTDSSFESPLGERVLWDTNSPDHKCDCPGPPPPPEFYLPPPPRPSSLVDSDCSDNSVLDLETCKAVPVIDAEYHYSPAIPSLAIILTVAVVVVVFLFIGTFLVALKRKKIQNLFPRKSSPQNRCDSASTNGVVYEDLTDIRPRTVSSPHCPPGQTTLSSIEMIDVVSCPERAMFGPVFICPKSPVPDSYASQELFNPVYEELSNGSEERGETDSEGMPNGAVSEDEFAEDELSLGGEPDISLRLRAQQDGPAGNEHVKDVDFSDADDKSKFLENCERNSSLPADVWEKGKKTSRKSVVRGTAKKPKSLDRRKLWKNKGPPTIPAGSVNCNEFHEGFLFKKILQIYPDVTGVGLQYSRGPPGVGPRSEDHPPPGGGRYESLAAFNQTPSCRLKPEVFSTFGAMQSSGKNQSQDSSLGSDSGYSNNTSGEKSSSRARKEYRLSNRSDPVLS